jgi:cytochrome d ubiquinol oxidase subunit II
VRARAEALARKLWPVVLVVGAATVVASYFATDIFRRLGVNPGISAIGAGVAFLAGGWFITQRRFGWAFGMNALTIALTVVTTFRGLFPRVMVSSLNDAWSLTVQNASSTPYTLRVMTIIALVLVPIVLVYQGWNYYVFRHRVTGKGKLTY